MYILDFKQNRLFPIKSDKIELRGIFIKITICYYF